MSVKKTALSIAASVQGRLLLFSFNQFVRFLLRAASVVVSFNQFVRFLFEGDFYSRKYDIYAFRRHNASKI